MADILIIEDDEHLREFVASHLENAGHTVRQAGDGKTGLDQAIAAAPDLILLDLSMPVMDGATAVRQLRAHPATAQVPVIALSAHIVPELRDDLHSMGCDAYVVKPVDFQVLLGKIDSLLKG